MKKQIVTFAAMIGFALWLASCAGAGEGDPATIVEQYMQAKVESDATTIQQLLCAEMESFIERETLTFQDVSGVEIESMTCLRVGETDTVTCEGAIVALYGGEETRFPLTTYRVVQEDGEWKWCGESY